ncbi:MAG: MBL fold metallo-hydrolase [Verrucomicrobiales bacterium]|nr:MBL fold metallo-hydrolase [Verrucomicrobiales bacterium]
MAVLGFEYREGGIWLPALRLWLDASRAQSSDVRVFVSHAHSDHTARHREILAGRATARFMEARLGGGSRRRTHELPWREPQEFETEGCRWSLTLLPAGHIFGSAMALVRAGSESLLYTGDFKLGPSLTAEGCEPVVADDLIMETTFGRPKYVFPPREEVVAGLVEFCRVTLREGGVPVLLGYALGKAQELVALALAAGLPVAMHPNVARMMKVFRECGGSLPAGDLVEAPSTERRVLVCPPGAAWQGMVPLGVRGRVAMATGWAMDPGARYRYRADAAFPLSDHAGFPELLEMVERVRPSRVHTLHGFASEFACRLRERGWDARALSEPDQLELGLA